MDKMFFKRMFLNRRLSGRRILSRAFLRELPAKLSGIFWCGRLNIRKWPGNPRIYIIVLLLIGFLYTKLNGIHDFCADADVAVTPWLFPFLLNNTDVLFMLMMGILLLFCDAPFIDAYQPNLIIRMGKKAWALGQIVYIMLASALYFAAVFVISVLVMIPHMGFSLKWGQIIGTLVQTAAAGHYEIPLSFGHSQEILTSYSPLSAMAWCFLLAWLIGVFLGLVHYVINQSLGRGFGTAAALVLLFLPVFAQDMGSGRLFTLDLGVVQKHITIHYFTPVSWAGLGSLDISNVLPLPSRGYALCALIGLNVVLGLLAVVLADKKSVNVLPPV